MEIRNIKKLIIVGSIIFIVVLFIFVWNIFFVKEKREVVTPTPIPSEPTTYQKSYPTVSIPPKDQEKITISEVIMDNFYKEGRVINSNNDVVISESSDYRILYFPLFQQFVINILSSSFESAKKSAEDEFIKSLSIGQADACKLKVIVGTTYSVNPEFAKKSYKLSFCENLK